MNDGSRGFIKIASLSHLQSDLFKPAKRGENSNLSCCHDHVCFVIWFVSSSLKSNASSQENQSRNEDPHVLFASIGAQLPFFFRPSGPKSPSTKLPNNFPVVPFPARMLSSLSAMGSSPGSAFLRPFLSKRSGKSMVSSEEAGEAAGAGPWLSPDADLAAAVGSAERRRE